MEGKSAFTTHDIEFIRFVLRKLRTDPLTKSQKTSLRQRLRGMGFYISDFSPKRDFTEADLDVLISAGTITVVDPTRRPRSISQGLVDDGFIEGPVPPELVLLEQAAAEARERFDQFFEVHQSIVLQQLSDQRRLLQERDVASILAEPGHDDFITRRELVMSVTHLNNLHETVREADIFRAMWYLNELMAKRLRQLAQAAGLAPLAVEDSIGELLQRMLDKPETSTDEPDDES